MHPSLHTRFKTISIRMGRARCKCSETTTISTIGRKGFGFSVLKIEWINFCRLFGKSKNNNRGLLLIIFGPTEWGHKKKRSHLWKKVLYFSDKAPGHTSLKSVAKLNELGYELQFHLPYSLDLALIDYYLFPNLKRWLQRKKFESNEEVEWKTDAYFGGLNKSYYKKVRWTRCIEVKGNIVE